MLHNIKKIISEILKSIVARSMFLVLRPFQLGNKVVIRSFEGKKYGDNPQYIVEELLKIDKDTDIVWIKNEKYDYQLPEGVRCVPDRGLQKFYEYFTAKVWIDTHRINRFLIKRKGQLYIETWHGGLGIKKIDGDVDKFKQIRKLMNEIKKMCDMADVFISNSDHLTRVYRSAFSYKGKIWKCGYPKNDILVNGDNKAIDKVRAYFGLPRNAKILLYAPTFRDKNRFRGFDQNLYDIDFDRVHAALVEKTRCNWYILQRHHPFLLKRNKANIINSSHVMNANQYPDMQELILSADAFISDYSSCIFDAALRLIPCFTYAKDFEEYKGDRGVYYEMEELPFPYSRNNDELVDNIKKFNMVNYLSDWNAFKEKTGYFEPGDAGIQIAKLIHGFLEGQCDVLAKIESEL